MSQTPPAIQSLPETSDDGVLHEDAPEEEGLSPDDVFHLLQTTRRRDTMRYLHDHDSPVRMRDLAEQVAAWENDTTVEGLSSTQRQRVYIPLYQTHLPKLDEAGVIEYEQSRGVVEATELADVLYAYIDGIDPVADGSGRVADGAPTTEDAADGSGDADRDWFGYYTGASGLGIGLVAGSALGIPVLSTIPGLVIGTIVSVMFGLLTLARHLERAAARPIE